MDAMDGEGQTKGGLLVELRGENIARRYQVTDKQGLQRQAIPEK